MADQARLHSAAAERNCGPIVGELKRLLPPTGLLLEVASGTGQHAAHAAAAMPLWRWQPSDADAAVLASIRAWCEGLPNVLPPLLLDVMAPVWPGVPAPLDAIFNANMIHIAPWPVAEGLFAGAGRILVDGGLLFLYGPFRVGGLHTAPSNEAFDADLRRRNPEWGVRELERVIEQAASAGLRLVEANEMPANNKLLVFQRGKTSRGSS